MKIRLADEADSDALKLFYGSYPQRGPLEFSVQRRGSFFDQYRLQSNDFETYILSDREGEIQGMGSLVFRQGEVHNSYQTVGYATDLRISSNRRAIAAWSQHFLPLTREAAAKRKAIGLFSLISGVDPVIQNTLITPRARRRNLPVYQLLRKMDIVTILGRWPISPFRLGALKVDVASAADLGPLAEYLKKSSSGRILSFPHSLSLLEERFKTWPDFRLESFLVAKDKRGQIVGAVAPWNNGAVSGLIPTAFSGFVQTAQSALKIGSWLGWTNSMTLEKPLEIEFLTHLYANNADVFRLLIEEAYRRKAPGSFLVYPHFHNHPLTLAPKHFITSSTPASLHTVDVTGADAFGDVPDSPLHRPPEFELCLA